MGGRLAIAIRRGNGTEYISGRWTNPLPHWLSNPKFWDDGEVVDEYIKSGLENNTPTDRVFPDEYGIVIVDFQTKRVFSRQDYCGVGETNCVFLDKDDAANLLFMIKAGWVTRYVVYRMTPFTAPVDAGDAALNEPTLRPDEVEAFHAHLTGIATGESEEGHVSAKRFVAGMVSIEWAVPGWTFDDGKPRDATGKVMAVSGRAWQCWSEVEAFIKETGWKSPCWTQAEVDADFPRDDEEGDAAAV